MALNLIPAACHPDISNSSWPPTTQQRGADEDSFAPERILSLAPMATRLPVTYPQTIAPSTLHQNNSSPGSATSSSNTYLMAASPRRTKPAESYRPSIITTVGARPACLVNASVTYVGNDQIYAFGGFDQYTDEGWS
jgi:hypothetical protein